MQYLYYSYCGSILYVVCSPLFRPCSLLMGDGTSYISTIYNDLHFPVWVPELWAIVQCYQVPSSVRCTYITTCHDVNLVLPPGWIFITTLGKYSHVGPTVSRRYHYPQSGVFYDSFTIQNGCRCGNNHHFFVSKTVSTSGNNRVKLSVMVTIFIFWQVEDIGAGDYHFTPPSHAHRWTMWTTSTQINAQQKIIIFSPTARTSSLRRLYYLIKSTAMPFYSPPFSLYQHSSTGVHWHHVAHGNVRAMAHYHDGCVLRNSLHWPQATNLLPAANNMTIVLVEKRIQQHNAADEGTFF